MPKTNSPRKRRRRRERKQPDQLHQLEAFAISLSNRIQRLDRRLDSYANQLIRSSLRDTHDQPITRRQNSH